MGLKCKVSRQKGGRVVVTNEDGTPSQLFQDALAYTNDQEQALNLWATASTPEFKEFVGKDGSNDEVSLGEVVRFYNSMKKMDGKLTPSEKYEIKAFMKSSGVSTLSGLTSKLKNIFQKDGTPEYSPSEAVRSGMFLPEDLEAIDLEKINDLINRMEGESLRNDFTVPSGKSTEVLYRNPNYKNIFGASEFVTQEQVEQDVIALVNDFNSPEEFNLKMQELGYPELVDKYFNDEAFAKEFQDRFKNLRKIQVAEEVGGELIAGNTATASIVRNTMLEDINTLSLEADIDYISNITESVWKDSLPEVRTIVAEIEKELIEKNIDIIGLHKITRSRATILDILGAAKQMMSDPTEENIQSFSAKYDALFKTKPNVEVHRLENWQLPLTIIKMYTNKLPKEMFEQHGLISLGGNLYHKVSTTDDISSLYEYLYQEIKDGRFKLPSHLAVSDMTNKKGVLNDISNFVNSRETGFDFQNEKLSLYQVIFKHPAVNTNQVVNNMTGISTIKTDEDYLKTEFISDFYNYMLREKLANSVVYRETLSKFKITASDIQLTGSPANIQDLELGQELIDYLKLKKDAEVKKFIPVDQHGEMTEKLFYENNQELLPQYEGPVTVNGALVSIPATAQNYIRIGNIAYRKVVGTPTTDVFAMLQKPKNSSYYTQDVSTIGFDQRIADKMAEQDASSNRELSGKDVAARLKKTGILSSFVQKITRKSSEQLNKTAEQDQDTFENNLVSFIRQKGVTVVTDPIAVSKALETLGVNSINQMFDFESMNINQTLTVNLVDGNQLRVVPSTLSKRVRTPEAAFAIANQILQRIKKYQRDTAGSLFNENMATINGTTITLNIPEGLEDRVVAMQQLEEEMRRIIAEDKELAITDGGVNEELERGVDIDTLTDLGYNMLQTPVGEVLGFEHKGVIYLDSNKLNNNTTLHELIHVYQAMLSIKAKQGDTIAESIIQKRTDLFQDLVSEWKEFHKSNTGVGENNLAVKKANDTKEFEEEKAVVKANAIEAGNFLKAPNGEETNLTEGQWLAVRTQNFKNWFGDWENNPEGASKILDENGEPKVMYTGTSKDKEFDTFSVPRNGVWFVADPAIASQYAEENDSQGVKWVGTKEGYVDTNTKSRVVPVFIKATLVADFNTEANPDQIEKLRYADNYKKVQGDAFQNIYFSKPLGEKRFDAIDYKGDGSVIVVIEQPNQIKSATGNFGGYSNDKNQIQFSVVYNGSNKEFDTFSTEFIGKGQSGMLGGWGLYFTEREERAKGYAEYLGRDIVTLSNVELKASFDPQLEEIKKKIIAGEYTKVGLVKEFLQVSNDFREQATKLRETSMDENGIFTSKEDEMMHNYLSSEFRRYRGYAQEAIKNEPSVETKQRFLYITDMQDGLTFLDFDRKVPAEQYEMILATARQEGHPMLQSIISNKNASNGKDFYKTIADNFAEKDGKSPEQMLSELMLRAGISGNKMRAEGTIDYIVFDEELVTLQEKIMFSTESLQLQKEIGIDLSSPAYAQRPSESDIAYNERLLQEVEAYITAPEIAAKLDALKNSDPTLWQKIMDFIDNLTNWLKNQIGLEEYKGDVMGMSMAEYVDALGASVLKADYQVAPLASQAFKQELKDSEINSIRRSLRAKFGETSYTLEVLDTLQEAKKNPSIVGDSAVNDLLDNGVTLNNISELLLDDGAFESVKETRNYFRSIGGITSLGLAPILSGGKLKSPSKVVNEATMNAMILDSQLEDLSLHTETEEQELFDKIDNCGV